MKKDISALTLSELKDLTASLNEPAFRAGQIFEWLHDRAVSSFDEMTNIPSSLRGRLEEEYYIASCDIEEKYVSKADGTVKYLFRLRDGEYIESVVMKYKYGSTICVSSQAGCRMGCRFCASTIAGLKRNLTAAEIERQLHSAQKDLGVRISHIVLMGIGEPLDNFDNVMGFIENVTDPKGLNISARNITLSTCGIVPRIYELMEKRLQITLTVSLHAPNNRIRDSIMPVNSKWDISELIAACRDYAKATSRRVSFEYTLISGVNDSDECALELAELLKGMLCHVNLIPVNDVTERKNTRSSAPRINKFAHILQKSGINATIRRTLGSDINASCGQLRRKRSEVAQ